MSNYIPDELQIFFLTFIVLRQKRSVVFGTMVLSPDHELHVGIVVYQSARETGSPLFISKEVRSFTIFSSLLSLIGILNGGSIL